MSTFSLDRVVQLVRAGKRYAEIDESLIRQVAEAESLSSQSEAVCVKATRSKLHQVAGAYFAGHLDYAQWMQKLPGEGPLDPKAPAVKSLLTEWMRHHASTRERLPILERFFLETLSSIGPVHSVLDLACGLNPLAMSWMPLAPRATYVACDIYEDLATFLNAFFRRLDVQGEAQVCNLWQSVPAEPVQVAFLLKTIPCLEQLDPDIGRRLLANTPAEHLLVSFPVRSLGGRAKGMPAHYGEHMASLIEGGPWEVRRFEFSTELAFLLSRK
jgi:16S rRNA (guanine(1405)-N(7))-methyltransferase